MRATVRSDTRCPAAVSASARWRVDLVVHTSGDSGSPRVCGSTSAVNAGPSPGSFSVAGLRPPPGARTRPARSTPPSSSRTPRATVSGCTPVATATALIPPRPSSAASAPSTRRRCRSSKYGRSTAYRRATESETCASLAIAQTVGPPERKTYLISSRVLTSERPVSCPRARCVRRCWRTTPTRRALQLLDALDLALVGIGPCEVVSPLQPGDNFFTEDDLRKVVEAGAVGQVCLRFLDADGTPIPSSLDDLVTGVTPEQLRVERRWVV